MMVWRYCRSNGVRINFWMFHVTADATVMTKITAMPMPVAVSILLDTPMNGQSPRNRASTKLLTNTVLMMIRKRVFIGLPRSYSRFCMVLVFTVADFRTTSHSGTPLPVSLDKRLTIP